MPKLLREHENNELFIVALFKCVLHTVLPALTCYAVLSNFCHMAILGLSHLAKYAKNIGKQTKNQNPHTKQTLNHKHVQAAH